MKTDTVETQQRRRRMARRSSCEWRSSGVSVILRVRASHGSTAAANLRYFDVASHDICKHLADFVMDLYPPRQVSDAGDRHWRGNASSPPCLTGPK